MKKQRLLLVVLTTLWMLPSFSRIQDIIPNASLEIIYSYYAHLPPRYCDIGEHMHLLKQLAQECPHVTEIGIGPVVSTWGLLQGLAENRSPLRTYIGIDLVSPPEDYTLARNLAEQKGIRFVFQKGNDLFLTILPTDLLFIDSLHTYCQLTYELETFSPMVRKYIALHDTSEPWGDRDDSEYIGNYSEYPAHYNRTKRGLWPAVEDFLRSHSEWTLLERYFNCHGFTILQRTHSSE